MKKIKAMIAGLFMAGGASAAQPEVTPPIDINKPVENPALVAAIDRLASEQSEAAKNNLLAELNKAVYLVAIFTDEMHTTEPDEHGQVTVKKDSLIKVLNTSDEAGNTYLPLFTDWKAIGQYIDKPVNTLVMPAADAWSWVLNMGEYHGAVINPARNALPLSKAQIQFLLEQIEPNHSLKADVPNGPRP